MALITSLILFVVAANGPHTVNGFSCKDINNNDIDWFIVYKLPVIPGHSDSKAKAGTASYYMDSTKIDWVRLSTPVNGPYHPIGHTLGPLYNDNNKNGVSYLLYNDHPPNRRSNTRYGHAKGVLLFDKEKGFWLVHSLPRFPSAPGQNVQYSWAKNKNGKDETMFGQIFLCTTHEHAALTKIRKQIDFYKPFIYDEQPTPSAANVNMAPSPTTMKTTTITTTTTAMGTTQPFEDIFDMDESMTIDEDDRNGRVIGQKWRQPPVSILTFEREAKRPRLAKRDTSQTSSNYISIAKKHGREVNIEIYSYLAERLGLTRVFAQTWRNGPRHLLSCAGQTTRTPTRTFEVVNIPELKFPNNIQYRTSKDHSKWAVSHDRTKPWTCIGDLNRMESQKIRGGGFVCFNNVEVWDRFLALILRQDQDGTVPPNVICPQSNFIFVTNTSLTPSNM